MAEPGLPGLIEHLRVVVGYRDTLGVADAQLLERFATQHDEAAFELLVWRHAKMVLGACRRILRDTHEAEDAFQACFLALARKAGSVARRESVGGWLHKVAVRLALAARTRRGQRATYASALATRTVGRAGPDPTRDAEQREASLALEEEVNRLPDKFRVPFVLCCLEGRSNAEAARELGCPVGTIESRLARARQRLGEQLTRRGVTFPVGLVLAALGGGQVSAALVASTASAAMVETVGQAAALGLITPHVAALTEGVLRSMWVTKLHATAAVLLVVTLAGTGTWALSHGGAADGPSETPAAASQEAKVAKLIELLGSDRFSDREKATKQLGDLGIAALDALRKASTSPDAERRKRAQELVKRLEAQVARAEVLTPKRVRLAYKDTPLTEALADFRKKSGYDLALTDPAGKLKGRTISLDTGEVTFWQALGQFCEKANLIEAATPLPRGGFGGGMLKAMGGPIGAGGPGGAGGGAGGGPGGAGGAKAGGAAGGAGGPGMPGAGGVPGGMGVAAGNWRANPPPRQILLTDGKAKRLPTDDACSMRFRALEMTEVAGKAADGESRLTLEVSLEPRLRWQHLGTVTVNKAIDDRDQALAVIDSPAAAPPALNAAGGMPGGVVIGGVIAARGGGPPGPGRPGAAGIAAGGMAVGGAAGPAVDGWSRVAALRFKKGTKPATVLKELSGSVSARVIGEPRSLVTIDDVLNAAGKTAKGKDGGSVQVLAAQKHMNDLYTVALEVALPGDLSNGGYVAGDRILFGDPSAGTSFHELAVVDGKGNRLVPVGLRIGGGVKGVVECLLTFRNGAGQAVPTKLTLGESKVVSLEVPFSLRNVPLP